MSSGIDEVLVDWVVTTGIDAAMQTIGLIGDNVTKGDAMRGVDGDIHNEGIVGFVDGVDIPIEEIVTMTWLKDLYPAGRIGPDEDIT